MIFKTRFSFEYYFILNSTAPNILSNAIHQKYSLTSKSCHFDIFERFLRFRQGKRGTLDQDLHYKPLKKPGKM